MQPELSFNQTGSNKYNGLFDSSESSDVSLGDIVQYHNKNTSARKCSSSTLSTVGLSDDSVSVSERAAFFVEDRSALRLPSEPVPESRMSRRASTGVPYLPPEQPEPPLPPQEQQETQLADINNRSMDLSQLISTFKLTLDEDSQDFSGYQPDTSMTGGASSSSLPLLLGNPESQNAIRLSESIESMYPGSSFSQEKEDNGAVRPGKSSRQKSKGKSKIVYVTKEPKPKVSTDELFGHFLLVMKASVDRQTSKHAKKERKKEIMDLVAILKAYATRRKLRAHKKAHRECNGIQQRPRACRRRSIACTTNVHLECSQTTREPPMSPVTNKDIGKYCKKELRVILAKQQQKEEQNKDAFKTTPRRPRRASMV